MTKYVDIVEYAKLGFTKRVIELLSENVDVNAVDNNGDSAVICAARINDLSMMKILVEAGAKLNVRNASGVTPLGYATSNKNLQMIEYIREQLELQSEEPEPKEVESEPEPRLTGIYFSCTLNSSSDVERQIGLGCDINEKDNFGVPVIIVAARRNNSIIVELLLQAGVDVDVRSPIGETLEYWANRHNNKYMRSLIEKYQLLKAQLTKSI